MCAARTAVILPEAAPDYDRSCRRCPRLASFLDAVKCLPPDNKPAPGEVRNCNSYLAADLRTVPEGGVILALGRIAHEAVLRIAGAALRTHPFAHGARHAVEPGALALFDSYHCSRYNTNTGRLTRAMFRAVFRDVAAYLGRPAPPA